MQPYLDKLIKASLPAELHPEDIGQPQTLSFLEEHLKGEEIVLYASIDIPTYVVSVLVPNERVASTDMEDLLKWNNINPSHHWGYEYFYNDNDSLKIAPPYKNVASEILEEATPLVYARAFEGRQEDKKYYELDQKLAQTLGIHYVPERKAWCRLDDRGDIEDIVTILNPKDLNPKLKGNIIIIIKRDVLDEYLAASRLSVITLYDFHFIPGEVMHENWEKVSEDVYKSGKTIAKIGKSKSSSYLRGAQILESRRSVSEVVQTMQGGSRRVKKYAEFITYDWKNEAVVKINCDPKNLGNYFVLSNLPFEISAAFFRPEVLLRYKKDSEKYELEERSISCRNSWHLKSFDINEHGQIHAYLKDLGDLPYDEQLYWASFNEEPKGNLKKFRPGPISDRAFKTDFEGSWDKIPNPLREIKSKLLKLEESAIDWWTLKEKGLMIKSQYPYTSSPDEWADDLMNLDKLLIEGFNEKALRNWATNRGRTPELNIRSLGLLLECLLAANFELDHAKQILVPLHELHGLRTKLKGHASGSDAVQIKKRALTQHKSYRLHFIDLAERCRESFEVVMQVLES